MSWCFGVHVLCDALFCGSYYFWFLMSRACIVTRRGTTSGNTVSHSKRRCRRVFMVNLHKVSFLSDALGEKVRIRVSARGLRMVESKMGIDGYLLDERDEFLTKKLRNLKKKILAAGASAGAMGQVGCCDACDTCGVSCTECGACGCVCGEVNVCDAS